MIKLVSVRDYYGAAALLYQLLQERMPEQSISHAKMPSIDDHIEFFNSRPYRYWWIIVTEGHGIGAVYVTQNNEIGIGILNAYQRNGFASEAIKMVTRLVDPLPALTSLRVGQWQAHINPNNHASRAMFEKLGFIHKQVTYIKE